MINYYIKNEIIHIIDKSYLLCDYFTTFDLLKLKTEMLELTNISFSLKIDGKLMDVFLDKFEDIYILTVEGLSKKIPFKGYFRYNLSKRKIYGDETFKKIMIDTSWIVPENIEEPKTMKEKLKMYLFAPYDDCSFEGEYVNKQILKFHCYVTNKMVFGYVCNITTFSNALIRSVHSEKLRSIGLMTGGIAHDINNQLMVVTGSSMLLKKKITDPLLIGYIENIEEAAKANATLVRRLLKLSKPPMLVKENFNLVQTLNEVIFMMGHTSNKARRIVYDCKLKDMLIYGIESSISNALLNLCKNALEATEVDDGFLMVKASRIYLNVPPQNVISDKHFVKGKYFKVDIVDNGEGIPQEALERLFTPFSSTKDNDKGTGLGLVQVLGMSDDNQTLIGVTSKHKIGTTFSLYFKEVVFEFNSVEINKTSIMLIDDDNMVRMIVKLLLESLSYQVIDFANPFEAIRFYELNHDLISIVICDMMMPLKNGKDTYYELVKYNKNMKFIILSGYTDEQFSKDFLQCISGYLSKPVELDELKSVVSKVLTSSINS